MTLAIDVNGGRPTIATMASCNDVCDPSLAHYSFHSQLLSPRRVCSLSLLYKHNKKYLMQDVISIHKMKKLAEKAIMSGLKTHTKLYSALPQYLLLIRGGVDQGQISMVQTKEIAGIKRAVYKITHDKKNPLFKAWKLKAWKPKFIVVMYNKKVSEKIYEYQHTEEGLRYLLPSRPCIVQQAITSQNIWDTLMYVGGGTRAHNKWKPSKVTILDFEIDQSEAANLYQLLHAMHYGYGYSVPFPMGPTAFPGMRLFHFAVCRHV